MKAIYKITDTNKGILAVVTLPEGIFNLTLTYKTGQNNRREWLISGKYPTEKYSILYDGNTLSILEKGGSYEIGQKVEHKAFGFGIITEMSSNCLVINFKNVGTKSLMLSIAKNFLK